MNKLLKKSVYVFFVCYMIAISQSSACDPQEIAKCNEHITSLSASDYSNLALVCQRSNAAMDCLEKQIDRCPQSYQPMLESTRQSIEQTRSMCANMNTGGDSTCSSQTILDCVNPLQSMTASERGDPQLTCSKTLKAIDCLEKEIKACPDFMKSQLQSSLDQLASAKSMCQSITGSGGDSTCSSQTILDCVNPLNSMTASERGDHQQTCSKTLKAVDCLEKEFKECPDFMKSQLQSSLDQLALAKSACQSITGSGGDSTCSYQTMWDCIEPIQTMTASEKLDPLQTCPKTLTAIDCLEKEIKACPDLMKSQVQSSLDQLASAKSMCQSITGSGNTAVGLASSLFMTLVVAILALFRHFL